VFEGNCCASREAGAVWETVLGNVYEDEEVLKVLDARKTVIFVGGVGGLGGMRGYSIDV